MQEPGRPVMRPPAPGVVVRSVTIAALWSMVAALVGAVVVLLAGLVGAAVVGVAWLVSNGQAELADTALIWRIAKMATWIVLALVVAVSVWTASYSSTEWGSRPRALVAIPVAGLVTVAYLLLGSSGLILAGLGFGWAVAIPAERIGRVATRAVPSLAVALFAPGLESLSGGLLAVLLAVSPWVAAILVWLSDWAWGLLTRWIARSAGG